MVRPLLWCLLTLSACLNLAPLCADDSKSPSGNDDIEALFKGLDRDGNGLLTAEEVPAERRRFLERLFRLGDANADEQLSLDEFRSATDPARSAPRTDSSPKVSERQLERPDEEALFRRLDVNGDGKIARGELPERARQLLEPIFKRLGKDEMTREEWQRVAARMGGGQNPSPMDAMFVRLDVDQDGKLTAAEVPERWRAILEGMLARLQRKPDGELTRDEFRAQMQQIRSRVPAPGISNKDAAGRGTAGLRRPAMPRFFVELDQDHDGLVSSQELEQAAVRLKSLDTNGDGQLDVRELLGVADDAGAVAETNAPPSEGPGPFSRSTSTNRAPSGRMPELLLRRFDRDGDGKVTLEEVPAVLKTRFSQLDRNGDGVLEVSDFPAREEQSKTGQETDKNESAETEKPTTDVKSQAAPSP